ncbi:hypothetical protein [Methanosarcina sp. 1.H.T.1A.1]|uniref:hypothetical protein n=1 Tax=Methanosarcina sp. 1.H.T.1A.1 TaxID=1483602 RepID=UPI00373AE779
MYFRGNHFRGNHFRGNHFKRVHLKGIHFKRICLKVVRFKRICCERVFFDRFHLKRAIFEKIVRTIRFWHIVNRFRRISFRVDFIKAARRRICFRPILNTHIQIPCSLCGQPAIGKSFGRSFGGYVDG